MRRLVSGIAALAFAASLGAAAFAKPHGEHAGGMMMGNSMKKKCPAGQHWVKGYVTKKGVKVKGHCSR